MRTKPSLLAPPLCCCGALLLLPSCLHVKTDPIEIKPITATLNVNVKVERQLDDFFAFEKQLDTPATAPTTTAPARQ